jgi:predicted kinase
MVGLPYSGKSTISKRIGVPIVNPDSIRVALHGQKFYAPAEPMVWAMAKNMVRALFLAGHDTVVLDATNTTVARRKEWLSTQWRTEFYCVPTEVEECINRAIAAGDEDMVEIIRYMDAKFEDLEDYELGK